MDISKIPFGPAAGMIKTYEQARLLVGGPCTRVTVGSITVEPRAGNEGDVYYFDEETRTSYNSLNLPNPGMKATAKWLPELKSRLNDCGQELVVSVAGFSPEGYKILTGTFLPLVDRVEENLGCPNVWGKDGQKPIASYHPEILGEILEHIRREVGTGQPISTKISPVESPVLLAHVLGQIVGSGCIDEIVGVNTIPNQSATRPDGRQALSFRASTHAPTQHVGGMAGTPLKEHGLRVLRTLQSLEIFRGATHRPHIIMVGGIFTAQDAEDYLDAGADGFEIGTGFYENPKIFQEIIPELMDL